MNDTLFPVSGLHDPFMTNVTRPISKNAYYLLERKYLFTKYILCVWYQVGTGPGAACQE